MSEFLAPLNYGRARDVLRRLSGYSAYTPQGAAQALGVLRESYPLVFDKLESKQFDNGAVLMEMPGASSTAPLVFVSHLDAAGTEAVAADSPHEMPISVPLSRAHVVALLEALEGLLGTEAPEEGLVERIALREAVDQLPEKERMTILLRYFKGLTQERAARVLGVSQVQVSRLERRGLERLRQSFAE